MNDHSCKAIIITCIDFRIQTDINKWIKQHFKAKTFDRVAFGGGVKNLETILSQIDIAIRLHHIKKVVVVNHEDCGAYGESGTLKKHAEDLKAARAKIKEVYPNLEVAAYYLHLNGNFEFID